MRGAIAVLAVLALAGCSGGGAPEASRAADPAAEAALVAAAANATANATAPRLTDTLFLAGPARLNATGLANLTVLATLAGAMPQSFAWNATLNGTGNASHARVLLWLDLQASAVQPGIGGDPGCTASLTLVVTHDGTPATYGGGCASAGQGLVPPGEHRLDLSTPLAGVALAPGDDVAIVVAFGLVLPQGAGYVLGGGERDSHLRLTGLQEPLPA